MALIFRSPIVSLAADVRDYFLANGVTAVVELGWRNRPRQDNQGPGGANRVVLMEGDKDGNDGELAPPQQPGRRDYASSDPTPERFTSRALCDWLRLITVSVWAIDGSDPTDEAKQIEVVEALFESTIQAIHAGRGAFANAVFGKVTRTPPHQLAYGREVLFEVAFRQTQMDAPRGVVVPSAAVVTRA